MAERPPYEGAPVSYLPCYHSRPLPTRGNHPSFPPFLVDGVPFYSHLFGSPFDKPRRSRDGGRDRDAPRSPHPVRILIPDDFGVLPEDLSDLRNVQLLNTTKSYKRAGLTLSREFTDAWDGMKKSYRQTREFSETHGVDMVRIILEICPKARIFCIPVFRNGNLRRYEDGVLEPLDDEISGLSLPTYSSTFDRPRILDVVFLTQVLRAAGSQQDLSKRMNCVCLGYAGRGVDEIFRDEIADAAGLGQMFFATPCCDAGRGIKHIFPGAYGIRGVAAAAAVRVDLVAFRMAKFRAVSSVVTMGAFGGKGTLLPVPLNQDKTKWKLVSGASFVAAEIVAIAAGVIQKYPKRYARDPVGLENYLLRILCKSVLDPSILLPDEEGILDDGTRFGIPSFSELPLEALVMTWKEKVLRSKKVDELQAQVKRLRSELASGGGGGGRRGGGGYRDTPQSESDDDGYSDESEEGDPDLETTW